MGFVEIKSTVNRSPLSSALWPPQAFSIGRSAALLAALVAVFILAALVGLASLVFLDHRQLSQLTQSSVSRLTPGVLGADVVQDLPALLLLLFALPAVAGRSLRELGLSWPRTRDLLYGVGGALAMFIVSEIAASLQMALFHIKITETAVQLFGTTNDPRLLAGMIFLAIILAPITEELIFRGFFFNALYRYMPAWLAIALSSIVFGLVHGLSACFPLACAGAVLAIVYYRSGSLTASMLTHALFNATSTTLLLATHGKG
jgi:membrane protease YdiL (CAAX protease family)